MYIYRHRPRPPRSTCCGGDPREGNVKLRALAEQVLADVLTLTHDKGAPLSRQTFDELFPESPRTRGSQKHITRSVTGSAYAEFVPGERASSLPRARRRTHHVGPATACDAVVYGPPLNSDCTALNGPRLCESLTPGARSLGVAA